MGKEFEKECTPETNTIINIVQNKNKRTFKDL